MRTRKRERTRTRMRKNKSRRISKEDEDGYGYGYMLVLYPCEVLIHCNALRKLFTRSLCSRTPEARTSLSQDGHKRPPECGRRERQAQRVPAGLHRWWLNAIHQPSLPPQRKQKASNIAPASSSGVGARLTPAPRKQNKSQYTIQNNTIQYNTIQACRFVDNGRHNRGRVGLYPLFFLGSRLFNNLYHRV